MNKLISLFVFICLLSFAFADPESTEIHDSARDGSEEPPLVNGETHESGIAIDNAEGLAADPVSNSEHVNEELSWANEPIVVVQEEPVPTIQLVPTEEPENVDTQATKDGEVIDNTSVDVVLSDPEAENQEVENGEYTSVIAIENTEENEEQAFNAEESDVVDPSEPGVLDTENGEYVFGATPVIAVENVEEKEQEGFDTEDTDDVDSTDAPVLVSESGEYTLEPTKGIEVDHTEIDKEEENFKTEDSDDVDTSSEVPVLDLENQDDNLNNNEVASVLNEEADVWKTEESDDVNDAEIPILAAENGEFNFRPVNGVEVNETDIDKEEQDFKTEDSDDVDNSEEVPVLELENQDDNNTDDENEITVVANEEADVWKTEESDDVNDAEIPVLATENGEFNFRPVNGVEVNETDIDKEEENFKTEDSDDVDNSEEVPVLDLENQDDNLNNNEVASVLNEEADVWKTEESDDVNDAEIPVLATENGEFNFRPVDGVEVNETDIDKEEENFKTEDSDDVDTSSEVPVLELENEGSQNTDDGNEDANGETTSVELPPQDLPDDPNEGENDNDDQDAEPTDAQVQTADVKEDGFLPKRI